MNGVAENALVKVTVIVLEDSVAEATFILSLIVGFVLDPVVSATYATSVNRSDSVDATPKLDGLIFFIDPADESYTGKKSLAVSIVVNSVRPFISISTVAVPTPSVSDIPVDACRRL